MTLTLDKPLAGVRMSQVDNLVVHVPRDGFCTPIVLDKPIVGLLAGTKDGKLLFLASNQKLAADGKLILNKPYIGRLANDKSTERLYVVAGKQCTGPALTCASCEICCTLDATIQLPLYTDLTQWDTASDHTLSCGATFTRWYGVGICTDGTQENSFYLSYGHVSYTGRDGDYNWDFGAPYGVVPVTIHSSVWISEEFTYTYVDGATPVPGTKIRIIFLAANWSYTTNVLHQGCFRKVIVQHQVETGYLIGYPWTSQSEASAGTANPFAGAQYWEDLNFLFEVSVPADPACEFELTRLGATDQIHRCGTDGGWANAEDCPLLVSYQQNGSGSNKCAKVVIMDNC